MFDGAFDEARALYENRLDVSWCGSSTPRRWPIDVGRERMGTDKRPGTIDMTRDGSRLRSRLPISGTVEVLRADLTLAANPAALMPDIEAAAATAGVPTANRARGGGGDGTSRIPRRRGSGRGLVVELAVAKWI
jgi:hypothetical protein